MQRSESHPGRRRPAHPVKTMSPAASSALKALCHALAGAARSTGAMADAMSTRRTGWMSIRRSAAAQAPEELQGMAARCQEADRAVQDAQQRLTQELGISPRAGASRICRHLPTGPAGILKAAADKARSAATRLEVETRMGQRLLNFASEAWVGLCRDVAQATRPTHHAYNQNARLQSAPGMTGTMLDGRM